MLSSILSSKDHHHLFFRHIAQTSPQPMALSIKNPIERAEGIYLYDTQGQVYIDLISGIAVSALGHKHPQVTKALQDQLQQYTHVMVYGECVLAPQVAYAQALTSTLAGLDAVYFTSSGSEAVEGAMKLAKRVSGRSQFICFDQAYHGSTQGALSLVGSEALCAPYRPLIEGVTRLPYNEIDALQAINELTAAVFIEPVQGEAGVRGVTQGFADALQARCREMGAWLVVDEAQTGLGRTGHLWAHRALNWEPEVLICAKALGGGLPLGAFIASKRHMDTLSYAPALGHISTFGGHPLCCAAGLASWRVITAGCLWENAGVMGSALAVGIRALATGVLGDSQLRQYGLLMAWDLGTEVKAQALMRACLDVGLLVDSFLFAPCALRIAPPLVVTQAEVDLIIEKLGQAVLAVDWSKLL